MLSLLIIALYSLAGALSVWLNLKLVAGDPRRMPLAYAVTFAIFGGVFLVDRFVLQGVS